MDRRERLREVVDGAECGACASVVPPERVRLLATREDLVFAELPCARCGSVSLAILVRGSSSSPGPAPGDTTLAPISADDVLDMHAFLGHWTGDLRSLLGRPGEDAGAAGDV